jgi:ectoine hydroxylase-related dioxygenase (phytanoyl-CoA dioxygenase family)
MNMPSRKPGDPGKHLWRDANIEQIPGRIIMFPAWLWHAVEENISDDIRISVSFNFIQSGYQ